MAFIQHLGSSIKLLRLKRHKKSTEFLHIFLTITQPMKTDGGQFDFGSVTPDLGNTVLVQATFWSLIKHSAGREVKS